MSPDEERRLIDAVRGVAAREILPRFRALGDDDIDTKSSSDDLVTVADTAAEAAISAAARDILPDITVIGEEAVARGATSLDLIAGNRRCLIVDPIDGTWNYANGIATFAVLLALTEDGRTTWGCIYDPVRDDWTVARPGQGARFETARGQSRRVRVKPAPPLAEAFGLIALYLYHGEERETLARGMMVLRRTQSLRCSAHEYRLLSDGGADLALNGMLNPWDHAAGALIYREAGGVARLLGGADYAPTMTAGRLLCAADETLWAQAARHFRDLAT